MGYKFDASFEDVPVPEDLTNGERAMVRALMEPGMPLWKIFRSVLDYGEGLKQSLLATDFANPNDVAQARKVQASAIAVLWLQQVFDSSLTDTVEFKPEEEPAK